MLLARYRVRVGDPAEGVDYVHRNGAVVDATYGIACKRRDRDNFLDMHSTSSQFRSRETQAHSSPETFSPAVRQRQVPLGQSLVVWWSWLHGPNLSTLWVR